MLRASRKSHENPQLLQREDRDLAHAELRGASEVRGQGVARADLSLRDTCRDVSTPGLAGNRTAWAVISDSARSAMNAEARQPVELLKNGKTNQYWFCDCCGHAVRELSRRGWCVACEHELTVVGKRVREKLNQMLGKDSIEQGESKP